MDLLFPGADSKEEKLVSQPQIKTPILLLDDQPNNLVVLHAVLSDPGYELVSTTSSREALEFLRAREFAVILSDVLMPIIDGFKFARMAREIPSTRSTPIIFLTAADSDESRILEAYAVGAVDFLRKPFEAAIVKAKVEVFVSLFRQRRQISEQARLLFEAEQQLRLAQLATLERERLDREERLQREAAEQTARVIMQSEEQLRLAFQAGQMGSWRYDLRSGAVDWSREHEIIFGVEPGGLGRSFEQVFQYLHPDDVPLVKKAFYESMQQSERFDCDFRIIRPDGTIGWIISRSQIYRLHDGEPYRVVGVVIDASKEKQAEEELRRLNRQLNDEIAVRKRVEGKLRLVTDALPAFISYVDRDQRYQFMNAAYEKWSGLPLSQLLGQSIEEVLGTESHRRILPHLEQAYGGTSAHFEECLTRGGEDPKWVAANYIPDFDDEGKVRGLIILTQEITERRKAEDDLRMQAQVLNSMVEGVILSNDEGRIIHTNPAEDSMFGYATGDLVGRHVSVLNDHKQPENEAIAERILSYLQSHGTWAGELKNIRKDGTRFITYARINTVELSGQPHFICVHEDVTERKAAQEKLKSSEERFRLMVEQVKDYGIITLDDQGRVIDWSPSIARITGFSADEMIGRDLSIIFTEEDRAAGIFEKELARAQATGSSESIRWHSRKDGNLFWAKGFTNALRHEDGSLRGFSKIMRDETENKRRQDAQNLLDRLTQTLAGSIDYQMTLQNMVDALLPELADWCVFDVLDRKVSTRHELIRHRDPKIEEIIRLARSLYRPGENSAHPVDAVLQQGRSLLLAKVDDAFFQAMAKDEQHLQLLRMIPCESCLIVPLSAHGIAFGSITLGIAGRGREYDESDVRLVEEVARRGGLALDNARLYSEAKEANRLKDEFLLAVSHELRTPLNAILGYADLIVEGYIGSEELQESVEIIHRNAVAQNRLVEDLLDISRIISGKMILEVESLELGKLIRDAIASIEVSARAKDIILQQDLAADLGLVTMDPTRVQQIVWNLLSNAVKFTAHGGLVVIRVQKRESKVEIIVQDNGRGINPSFLPYVFDRFRQEDGSLTRASGGLGLGLAITRQLVELHGGTIEVRSEGLGKGATFVVTLPIHAHDSLLDATQGAR